jgi:hypothetical protein
MQRYTPNHTKSHLFGIECIVQLLVDKREPRDRLLRKRRWRWLQRHEDATAKKFNTLSAVVIMHLSYLLRSSQ